MNAFNPRTFSTDWEVMILDKLNRVVPEDKCDAFAGMLRAELDLPVHFDWRSIEFAMGINHSFQEFQERVLKVTERAAEMLGEYRLDMFPAAAHPTDEMFYAAHIHIGTIHDEVAGIHLENQLMKYAPAFGALAANSPFSRFRNGGCKSYRMQFLARGCSRPSSVRDPEFSQSAWGGDAAPKVYLAPTMEVRIIDCASSRRFLGEIATFIAAFLHHQGERIRGEKPSVREYRDSLTNRWAAARDGMQASFAWEGGSIAVAELLDQMLDECAPSLEKLGLPRSKMTMIPQMIRKRICQADFAMQLRDRYPDPHMLLSAYAKLLRHWEIFDEYLDRAAALDPIPAANADAILEEHLRHIGESTHFYRLREAMNYPAPAMHELIEEMIARGLVRKEITCTRGTMLHRIRGDGSASMADEAPLALEASIK